jgi:hypothetical protein
MTERGGGGGEGGIKITVPTHGKVQTFQYSEFQHTNPLIFCIVAKSYEALLLNEKVKITETKEKDKLSV